MNVQDTIHPGELRASNELKNTCFSAVALTQLEFELLSF